MHHLDTTTITLAKGGHETRDDGVCLLEAVAWWAGEDHGDHPSCVSRVLGSFGRSLNDVLPDEKRQQLRPYITLMPGTAADGLDETRGYLALDWLIRTYTPAWLDLAGLTEEAAALRDLRRIADLVGARNAGPVVRETRAKAAAARAAAWDAARDAAWGAAWDAARAAGGAAARAAGGDAARDAAWDAAWDAARAAARDAARDAARAKLAPTVTQLQDSAIALLGTMIKPEAPGGA